MTAQSLRHVVEESLANLVPKDLAASLLSELDELEARFAAADFRPSELSGARFAEAAFRICQHVALGKYSPIGGSLPRTDHLLTQLEDAPKAGVDDTFRLHIPRSLKLLYDLRSKRDVAHLGDGVSPNVADSTLVLTVAQWITAEIVRVAHRCDLTTAQRIVDSIVQRETPFVWVDGDVIRVAIPDVRAKERTLMILLHAHPQAMSEQALLEAVEYSTAKDYRGNVLRPMHKQTLIDYRDGMIKLLPGGRQLAAKVIQKLLSKQALAI